MPDVSVKVLIQQLFHEGMLLTVINLSDAVSLYEGFPLKIEWYRSKRNQKHELHIHKSLKLIKANQLFVVFLQYKIILLIQPHPN